MLIFASLLTLSALLDLLALHTGNGAFLPGSVAAVVRLAAAVCWVGYLIAHARNGVEQLVAGNRDLILREMRRLERERRSASLGEHNYSSVDRRRAHLKSCE